MNVVLKVVLVIAVFMAAVSVAEFAAGSISGTPTQKLNSIVSLDRPATELANELTSVDGMKVVTEHSLWTLLIFVPIGSVLAATAGRLFRIQPHVIVLVIGLLVAIRLLSMAVVSSVYSNLMAELGSSAGGIGASIGVACGSLMLSIGMTILIAFAGYRRFGGNSQNSLT